MDVSRSLSNRRASARRSQPIRRPARRRARRPAGPRPFVVRTPRPSASPVRLWIPRAEALRPRRHIRVPSAAELPGPADDLGSPGSPHGIPLSHRHGWGFPMSLCQVEDDRPRTWRASISPWPWPASSRADATTGSARGAGSLPRGSGFAGGGAATYAGRRSGMASPGRVARRGAATPSSHPDPATLLHMSTTACRRMRSAPAPVPTRSPALLLGLHVFSALGGDGLGRSQAQPREPAWRKRRVPPLSIDPTTADVTVIHRLAASRLRGRRLSRHRRSARHPSGDPRQGRRHGP